MKEKKAGFLDRLKESSHSQAPSSYVWQTLNTSQAKNLPASR
jgi:hypothetical protein